MRSLFAIDPAVRRDFPEIKVAFAIVRGVRVATEHPGLEHVKQTLVPMVRARLEEQPIVERPRVQAFRRIYKKFGVDPNKRRPSAEALLRRVADPGKGLSTVNTVVDAYNLASIEYELPMAAYDLDRIAPPITLRFAASGELHRGIGQAEPDSLTAGELVYADGRTILCRDFNYRDADDTKVSAATTNLALFVDGCAEVDHQTLAEAIGQAAQRIIAFSGGTQEGPWFHPRS